MTEPPKITKRDINQCWGPYRSLYYFADVLNGVRDVKELREEILMYKQRMKELKQ